MGRWRIVIEGVGCHHNGRNDDDTPRVPSDAEKLAKNFVTGLQEAGHSIESATFTQTGHDKVEGLFFGSD